MDHCPHREQLSEPEIDGKNLPEKNVGIGSFLGEILSRYAKILRMRNHVLLSTVIHVCLSFVIVRVTQLSFLTSGIPHLITYDLSRTEEIYVGVTHGYYLSLLSIPRSLL
jgi:hypothetical protein